MTELDPQTREPSHTADPAPPDAPTDAQRQTVTEGAREEKGTPAGSWLHHLGQLLILVAFSFIIAALIKTFLVQAFYIPSKSMLPTLEVGDRVLVEKISYRLDQPERGDVVVFARSVALSPADLPWYQDVQNFFKEFLGLPTEGEQDYIKRVVAVAGDSIRYAGSPRRLVINGEPVAQPYVQSGPGQVGSTIGPGDCKRLGMERSNGGCLVPAGTVFVMGDNRDNSQDSRVLGPIDVDKLVGRAFLILWPPRDWSSL